jgi:hypothetical protein
MAKNNKAAKTETNVATAQLHPDATINAILNKAAIGADGKRAKLTRDEAAALRRAGVNKAGEIVKRGGPREKQAIDPRTLAGAVEFGGVQAVQTLFNRHGAALKKPLTSFARSFPVGSTERDQAMALREQFFPTQRGASSGNSPVGKSKGYITIGKSKRGALVMSHIGGEGQFVKPANVDAGNLDLVIAELRAYVSNGGKAIVLVPIAPEAVSADQSAAVEAPVSDAGDVPAEAPSWG